MRVRVTVRGSQPSMVLPADISQWPSIRVQNEKFLILALIPDGNGQCTSTVFDSRSSKEAAKKQAEHLTWFYQKFGWSFAVVRWLGRASFSGGKVLWRDDETPRAAP